MINIRRVAVVYDDRDRPETTGVYCRRSLEALVEVAHFLPDQIGEIPRQGFDLYLNVDDGLEYRLDDDLRPCAWWAIDTHLNFSRCLEKARTADLVFAAQQNGAERLQREGIATAQWLPLACDPEVHRKFRIEKNYDVTFIGNVFPGPRSELLGVLEQRFRNILIGQAYFEDMARAYSASRIVFNRSLEDDINMRVFEALACGSLLVTNDLAHNGQSTLFRDGIHLATYSQEEELVDKIAYYLAHDEVREKIAAAGRAQVLAKHTYRHRMETLLEKARRELAIVQVQPAFAAKDSGVEARDAKASDQAPYSTSRPSFEEGYYGFARPEILALIPRSARRILEIGCGAGRLGESLKARQQAKVVGIEFSPQAAEHARGRLDEVIIGDVERLDLDFEKGTFDCVVCGDVLEHLREPARLLERARGWLDTEGLLVASIPNARHYSVVNALLGGNWTYEPAGLMDETHLGFFTRRDMVALFEESGYRVAHVGIVPGPGYDDWQSQGCPGEVRAGALHIANTTPEDAEEFFVYQYLWTATVMRQHVMTQTEVPGTVAPEVHAPDGSTADRNRRS